MTRGKLTIFTGPMFAGKTTALLHERAANEGQETQFVFTPDIDKRYEKEEVAIHSHNHERYPATALSTSEPEFAHLVEIKLGRKTAVYLDEVQFYPSAQFVDQINRLLMEGVDIYLAGLDYDAFQKPFGPILSLKERADRYELITGTCDNCGEPSLYSYRKGNNHERVLVGSVDAYGACCGDCWMLLSQPE